MNAESVLKLAKDRRGLYKIWQLVWFLIHYTAGFFAIVSGCLATASAVNEAPSFIRENTWIWGLLASLLSSVVTFLEPLHKAQVYKRAYYDLSEAIASLEDGMLEPRHLHAVLVSSQNIVVSGQFSVPEDKGASVN